MSAPPPSQTKASEAIELGQVEHVRGVTHFRARVVLLWRTMHALCIRVTLHISVTKQDYSARPSFDRGESVNGGSEDGVVDIDESRASIAAPVC
jgi:hypothetical protein